jgi:hypothetical protein
MSRERAATVVILAAVIVGAAIAGVMFVRGPSGSTIDGWAIGDRIDCQTNRCQDAIDVARSALDAGLPGHPEVADAALYARGGLSTTTIPFSVVVFRFRDGSERAVGVGYAFGQDSYRPFGRLDP